MEFKNKKAVILALADFIHGPYLPFPTFVTAGKSPDTNVQKLGPAYFHSKSCALFLFTTPPQHIPTGARESCRMLPRPLLSLFWTCSGIPLTAAYWLFFFIYRKIVDFNDSNIRLAIRMAYFWILWQN